MTLMFFGAALIGAGLALAAVAAALWVGLLMDEQND